MRRSKANTVSNLHVLHVAEAMATKMTLKEVHDYLKKIMARKKSRLPNLEAQKDNPTVHDLYIQCKTELEFCDALLRAIETGSKVDLNIMAGL